MRGNASLFIIIGFSIMVRRLNDQHIVRFPQKIAKSYKEKKEIERFSGFSQPN